MAMKAFAVRGKGRRPEPVEYEPGPLGKGEVEVKVEYCGIGHSDLAMIDDERGFSFYPVVPCHEVVGTIAAVGDGDLLT